MIKYRIYRIINFFSHPDYTVGFGITPNHALRLVGFTTGGESRPALKNVLNCVHVITGFFSCQPIIFGFVYSILLNHTVPAGIAGGAADSFFAVNSSNFIFSCLFSCSKVAMVFDELFIFAWHLIHRIRLSIKTTKAPNRTNKQITKNKYNSHE